MAAIEQQKTIKPKPGAQVCQLPAADRELAIKTINTILTETSYKLIAENDNGELDSIIINDQLVERIGVLFLLSQEIESQGRGLF